MAFMFFGFALKMLVSSKVRKNHQHSDKGYATCLRSCISWRMLGL